MMIRACVWLGGLLLASLAWGAEVGLVTSLAGKATLQEEKTASELKPFVKLRAGDRLALGGGTRLQLVYFEGGRQETWQGAGQLEVGAGASKVLKGGLQPEVKILPAILVKQLSKTPSADGNVKAGMVRMRSIPSGGTLESVEKTYADLRQKADAADRNPELYLLSGYFELREFERVEQLLRKMDEKAPGDMEVRMLKSLYARAISNAKMAVR